jgi:hypothetical protein
MQLEGVVTSLWRSKRMSHLQVEGVFTFLRHTYLLDLENSELYVWVKYTCNKVLLHMFYSLVSKCQITSWIRGSQGGYTFIANRWMSLVLTSVTGVAEGVKRTLNGKFYRNKWTTIFQAIRKMSSYVIKLAHWGASISEKKGYDIW